MDQKAHPCVAGALTRRRFVTSTVAGAAALTTSTLIPGLAFAARELPGTRSLGFRNLHTGEEVATTYVRDNVLQPEGFKALCHVMRDWRTGEVWDMDPKLLDLLYALRRRMDSTAPFDLISAYRSPKTNAKLAANSGGVAKRSLHMRGMASDISLPERDLQALHQTALALEGGGVGLYSKSGFLHVDTGRVRRWGS